MTADIDSHAWREWDCFVEANPATGFMQSSWWARCRAPVGFDYFALTLKDGAALIGGALVAKWYYGAQRCFYYIQDGPVLPSAPAQAEQVFAALLTRIGQRRLAEDATVSHLRIEPRWEHLPSFVQGFRPLEDRDEFTEPRDTLCIDLRLPEEALLAQMKPKGRYNIRLAQRHGVNIVQDNSAEALADFIRIQRRTALRQGIATKPPSYFRALWQTMLPDKKLALFFAEYRARRIAAALVVYFGDRATYFFGGSLALYRQVMAPYLLHFEIMREARAQGLTCYDLWGVAPEHAIDHPWLAISSFKRKFGGNELRLVPTLDLVFDQEAYREYIAGEPAGD